MQPVLQLYDLYCLQSDGGMIPKVSERGEAKKSCLTPVLRPPTAYLPHKHWLIRAGQQWSRVRGRTRGADPYGFSDQWTSSARAGALLGVSIGLDQALHVRGLARGLRHNKMPLEAAVINAGILYRVDSMTCLLVQTDRIGFSRCRSMVCCSRR